MTNQFDISGDRYERHCPERFLWTAVIWQAKADLVAPYDNHANREKYRGEYLENKEKAYNWFNDAGPHFKYVCQLAGYEWSWIKRLAEEYLWELREEFTKVDSVISIEKNKKKHIEHKRRKEWRGKRRDNVLKIHDKKLKHLQEKIRAIRLEKEDALEIYPTDTESKQVGVQRGR